MKIITPTSNNWAHLISGMSYCFNKFWSPDQEVTVLYYDNIPEDLPKNFKCHSLGNQEQFGSIWSNPIKKYLLSIDDEYVLIIFEDYFMTSPLRIDLLEIIEKYIDGKTEKIDFLTNIYREGSVEISKNVYKANKNSLWKGSYQTSLWRKDFFIKSLLDNASVWQCEENFSKSLRNQDNIIIGCNEAICPTMGVYKKGKLHNNAVKLLPENLKNELYRLGYLL